MCLLPILFLSRRLCRLDLTSSGSNLPLVNTACAPTGAPVSSFSASAWSRNPAAIFRHCFAVYLDCIERPSRRGRKSEEFIADFELVGERSLAGPLDRLIFKLYFLHGADARLCCRRTELGSFALFQAIRR